MPLRWPRTRRSPQHHTDGRQRNIERVAHQLYQNRLMMKRSGDAQQDWTRAEEIVRNPYRYLLFNCHRPFIRLENQLWEPIHTWANNQALLSLLGLVGNIGLIFAVVTYVGAEKQRRDSEVLTAWQTLTSAHGQPGNGGRIYALEFLNASPRNPEYDYPGANWRRRSICLWLCTWPSERLAGIDLSVDAAGLLQFEDADHSQNSMRSHRVFLVGVQLPEADLAEANLQGANLRAANLEEAYLENTNLASAYLQEADLTGAYLVEANLQGADLGDANLSEAYLVEANLQEANLGDANLTGADLREANLQGSNLSFIKLTDAYLRAANLERAYLEDANLAGANLVGANLRGANLWDADLKEANLWDADLKEAELWGTNLEGADLWGTNLEGADLSFTNLKGADNLAQQQLNQAKLCRTQIPDHISLDPNRDCEELGIEPTLEPSIGD